MCIVCNPLCGSCKPPLQYAKICPACGKLQMARKSQILGGETILCGHCSMDMTEQFAINPVDCLRSGKKCAYPCGKRSMALPNGAFYDCPNNTPVV